MPDTTFNPGTVVTSAWLNDINDRAFNTDGKEFINLARDYNLSPGDDITAALRAAMATGKRIYIAGTADGAANDWLISDTLPITSYDQIIEGDGHERTRIRSTANNTHAFTAGALPFNRFHLRDLGISTLGTGSPAYFPYTLSNSVYDSTFTRCRFSSETANAFHIGHEFNISVRDCLAESDNGHAFFVQGGNTTVFDRCYALSCGPDKAGYRSLGGGQFNSCNGINSGGSCFWFGCSAADTRGPGATGDGDTYTGNTVAWANLVNCNMESFTKYGLKSIYQGNITITGGKIAPDATSYVALIDAGTSHKITLLGNPRVDTITATRVAYVADGVSSPLVADYNRRANSAKYCCIGEPSTRQTGIMTTATSVRPMSGYSNEETPWTSITLVGATTPGTNVLGSQLYWQQVGESTRLHGRLVVTTKDAAMAGAVRLEGLPALPNNSIGNCGMAVLTRHDGVTLSANYYQFVVRAESGNTYLRLQQIGSGGNIVDVQSSALATGAELFFDLTYYSAAT